MELPSSRFTALDWTSADPSTHAGETGSSTWLQRDVGSLRTRVVHYAPGYLADHWCTRGHVLHVIAGDLRTELRDGRSFEFGPGTGYVVSDSADEAHRSSSRGGATVFIVD